jgi:murein DD-endopeptidase MepM/ murein hydrolase activator NlpD
MNELLQRISANRFAFVSWLLTAMIVMLIVGVTMWRIREDPIVGGSAPGAPAAAQGGAGLPLPANSGAQPVSASIPRSLALKTSVTGLVNTAPITYRVMQGDSVFAIAKQYSIEPESILYSNEATLNDNPSNLTPGMELVIPPVDGLTYVWKEGDTLDAVADKFKSDVNKDKTLDTKDATLIREAVVSWPSNDLDLTNPTVKVGQQIMIPAGKRELVSWLEFVPTINRQGSTATSELGGGACAAGPGSPPGLWPTDGPHTLSGNNYSGSHLGIDITASTSTAVLASGGGVVVFAGFSQYGYGNVVQIDHMDGFATVYGHLSQINVSQCQVVYGGQVIGMAGSTGNSTGVHLHFEVRQGNVNMNPWSIVQ